MTHQVVNLTDLHAARKNTINFALVQQDGVTEQNLAGKTVQLRVAATEDGPALIDKDDSHADITITDSAMGLGTAILQAAETAGWSGTYYYEINVIDALGDPFTFVNGEAVFDPAIGGASDDAATAQTRAYYLEAKAARHALLMGASVVGATYGGKTIQYRQTNLGQLNAYIQDLEFQLGIRTVRRKALGVSF